MSSLSSEFSGSGEFSGDRAMPEKTSFSLTCNLLSQYLKEKGSIRDLGVGMSFNNGKGMSIATEPPINKTMNLFPNNGEISNTKSEKIVHDIKSMDLFPQHSGFGLSVYKDEVVSNTIDYSINKPTPEASQMTIFYNGQVIVFDNITSDVANKITLFARKTSNQDPNIFATSPIHTTDLNFVDNKFIEKLTNDLPIARKASLTRFLEKRKDRISSRAPYPKNKKSWLGLSPQSSHQQ